MSKLSSGIVLFPNKLELLANAEEMYEGNCTDEVIREGVSRLAPALADTSKIPVFDDLPLLNHHKLGGLAVEVNNGTLELGFPADAIDISMHHRVGDKVYIPRDCDSLVIMTGKTCLALIAPSEAELLEANLFGIYDIGE